MRVKTITSFKPRILSSFKSFNIRLTILILLFIILLYFRYTVLTSFYMIQTFYLWNQFTDSVIGQNDDFDSSMMIYPLNQSTSTPNHVDVVPPIIHHIVIGSIDLNQRPTWLKAREACLKWHPGYEYRFWNDSEAENLIRTEFPSFYQTWISYPYPIQRADSLRYLVLYRYGGIFLDMDLHCRRSLGPLRRFEFVSPAAYPVGISNGFLMASKNHPFFKILVNELPLFDRRYLLPYATVMFSTGCMYISAQFSRYQDRPRLRVLNYTEHRLSGHIHTPLFVHEGSSSWHAGDASFIKHMNNLIRFIYQYQMLFGIHIVIFILLVIYSRHRRRTMSLKVSDSAC